jgi:hypothetical protein
MRLQNTLFSLWQETEQGGNLGWKRDQSEGTEALYLGYDLMPKFLVAF